MRTALERHDQLLRETIEANGGVIFKAVEAAFCAAFMTASDALNGAIAAQQAIGDENWPAGVCLRTRMAIHTGAAEERDGDYFGQPLNRTARLLSTGHGGQTLLSEVTRGLTVDALPPSVALQDLGERRLKDLGRPERVFQLLSPLPCFHIPPTTLAGSCSQQPAPADDRLHRAGK